MLVRAMKIPNILFALVLISPLTSCDQTDEGSSRNETMLYELQFINAGMSGLIIQKEDLDFNEFFEFSPDSTFIKRRVYADSSSIAKGVYSLAKSEDRDFFELHYQMESYLIQNCERSLIERVSILNGKEIFNGSYMPCDGPGYGYQLVD